MRTFVIIFLFLVVFSVFRHFGIELIETPPTARLIWFGWGIVAIFQDIKELKR